MSINAFRAENEQLKEKLLKYGTHRGHCTKREHIHLHWGGVECDDDHPCDCGWDELRRVIQKEKENNNAVPED